MIRLLSFGHKIWCSHPNNFRPHINHLMGENNKICFDDLEKWELFMENNFSLYIYIQGVPEMSVHQFTGRK